jgi:hypothetical protein
VVPVRHGPSTDRAGVRSRLVADVFGAPVLRDKGPDRPAGHGKADSCPRPSRLVIANDDGGQLSLITARSRWVGARQPDKPGGTITVNQRVQRVAAIG